MKGFSLQENKILKFKKDDKTRVVVVCEMSILFENKKNSYKKVTSFVNEHVCARSSINRQAKTKFLVKQFMPILRHTLSIKITSLVEEARLRWGIYLGKWKAYREQLLTSTHTSETMLLRF